MKKEDYLLLLKKILQELILNVMMTKIQNPYSIMKILFK